ncbi:hypothetical protein P3G55_06565 [Leptospira sp. 96542]|nr:hypothetical protein [Leptospira sp. 96542]
MKKLKSIVFLLLLFFGTNVCKSSEVQVTNKQALFQNCMETFEDEARCKKLLEKSEADLRTEAEEQKLARENLTKEQKDGLKIRSVVKDSLQSQNKGFVKNYLGEPDKIEHGGDREYWVYTRPVTRYSVENDPDEELTVIFRRNKVERINHIKPASTPDSDLSVKKLFGNKEVKENQK